MGGCTSKGDDGFSDWNTMYAAEAEKATMHHKQVARDSHIVNDHQVGQSFSISSPGPP